MARKPLSKSVNEVRVLLSQCFRPWGIDDEYNTKFLTYEGSKFSILDGIWAVRGVCSEVATHFIASNLPVYTKESRGIPVPLPPQKPSARAIPPTPARMAIAPPRPTCASPRSLPSV